MNSKIVPKVVAPEGGWGYCVMSGMSVCVVKVFCYFLYLKLRILYNIYVCEMRADTHHWNPALLWIAIWRFFAPAR